MLLLLIMQENYKASTLNAKSTIHAQGRSDVCLLIYALLSFRKGRMPNFDDNHQVLFQLTKSQFFKILAQ